MSSFQQIHAQTDHKSLKYLKDAAYQNTVQEYSAEDSPVGRTLRQISGAGLDILVNGQTFIPKHIFLFFVV